MKKFLIIVISLVILTMASYGIAYLVMPVSSIELNKYTHSAGFICDKAYIVRDEAVYFSDTEGVVYNIAADGSRVAQNTEISTIYNGDVDINSLKQLSTIDKEITRLNDRVHDSKLYSSDSDSSESRIADKMTEIIDYAETNDVAEVEAVRHEINNTRQGLPVDLESQIEQLEDERRNVEKSISARNHDIKSDRAGVFSSYIDGLENVLVPEDMERFTPEELNKLEPQASEYRNGKRITASSPVCKVMNNHVWYIAGIANEERTKQLREHPSVTVRFIGLTETDASGEVAYIGEPDGDGNSVFLVKASNYVESAFAYRTVSVQIIFNEYSGYKVPTDSIRTGMGKMNNYYVLARKGSESYKCEVDVLYSDSTEGFSIIESLPDADNKLGVMDRLIVGER